MLIIWQLSEKISIMVQNEKLGYKDISIAKIILASLWHEKESGRNKLLSHRYIKELGQNKHKNTYRSSISRLCKLNILKKEYNNIISLTKERTWQLQSR